jgi:hypothetical protein
MESSDLLGESEPIPSHTVTRSADPRKGHLFGGYRMNFAVNHKPRARSQLKKIQRTACPGFGRKAHAPRPTPNTTMIADAFRI